MDASTAALLPPFVVFPLMEADEYFEQTPVGGTPGEHVAIIARIGVSLVAASSHDHSLNWHTFDTEEEAIAAFAHQVERGREIVEYAARPDANPHVLVLMVQHGMPLAIAERFAQMGERLGDALGLAEQPVRAIGRASVPTGTTYVGSNQVDVHPNTGMYL
jgi:hypothetical protein